MERIELLEPVFRDGILNTNFFNGRLLSAEDLRTEQSAARQRAAQLGRAVGAGIVEGLRVRRAPAASPPGSTASSVVTVTAGLAINGRGQALELYEDTEVTLAREADEEAAEAGLFAACRPPQTTAIVAGVGVYLLAVSPASGFTGRAPASGIGGTPLSSPGCGSRYAVEGVQFRLLDLALAANTGLTGAARAELLALFAAEDAADVSLLRNLLAHACFGTAPLGVPLADPFGQDLSAAVAPGYGIVDALRADAAGLTPCDVPLALIFWTEAGIRFVDMWAVRRRVTRAETFDRWSFLTGDRRLAEGEAMFRQFQEQAEELLAEAADPGSLRALDHFRYLPPVGVVPLALTVGERGYDHLSFLDGMTFREAVFMEGARLPRVVRDSWAYPPVDLRNPIDVDSRPMFWLYNVRENTQRREQSAATLSYLVFSSGQMPFAGKARYDVSRWDYSNYL